MSCTPSHTTPVQFPYCFLFLFSPPPCSPPFNAEKNRYPFISSKAVLLKGFTCPQKKCWTSHCLCVKKKKENQTKNPRDKQREKASRYKVLAGSIGLQKCATPALLLQSGEISTMQMTCLLFFFFFKKKKSWTCYEVCTCAQIREQLLIVVLIW